MTDQGAGIEHKEGNTGTGKGDEARAYTEDKTDLHRKQKKTHKQGSMDDSINQTETQLNYTNSKHQN